MAHLNGSLHFVGRVLRCARSQRHFWISCPFSAGTFLRGVKHPLTLSTRRQTFFRRTLVNSSCCILHGTCANVSVFQNSFHLVTHGVHKSNDSPSQYCYLYNSCDLSRFFLITTGQWSAFPRLSSCLPASLMTSSHELSTFPSTPTSCLSRPPPSIPSVPTISNTLPQAFSTNGAISASDA